jgi:hypothetical protein
MAALCSSPTNAFIEHVMECLEPGQGCKQQGVAAINESTHFIIIKVILHNYTEIYYSFWFHSSAKLKVH